MMIISARISITCPFKAIQNELLRTGLQWETHFNKKNYEGSWTGLALTSAGGSGSSILPGLHAGGAFYEHRNMSDFPAVKSLLKQFRCPVGSVRFLNLAAGAVIKPHHDRELSYEQGEVRLHFPIVTNPAVEFYVQDQRVTMQAGECWYINANLKHQVFNGGNTDRIHLVIDCSVNDWLIAVMNAATDVRHGPDYSREQLMVMIAALREQQTTTADQLADQYEKEYNQHVNDEKYQ